MIDEDYLGGPFPVSHVCGHDTHAVMLMVVLMILAGFATVGAVVAFLFRAEADGVLVDGQLVYSMTHSTAREEHY